MNALLKKIDASAEASSGPLARVYRCNLIYADDVLCASAQTEPETAQLAADESDRGNNEGLGELGLRTAPAKSENSLLNPFAELKELFRRGPGATATGEIVRAEKRSNGRQQRRI